MNHPLLIAHRGESFDAPENTHAAFDLAWQRGDDAIELDVHVTAGGQAVVCHDDDLFRTGGVAKVIANESYEALRHVDVGRWKGDAFAGERLPLLSDVLGRVPVGKGVMVEIKSGVATADAAFAVLAEPAWRAIDMRVISFRADVLRALARRAIGCKTYWLIEPQHDTSVWQPSVEDMLRTAADLGVHGVDVGDGPWLDEAAVDAIHRAGLEVAVWTVDDARRARQLAAMDVDAITTNRAAWMRDQFAAP